MKRRAAHMGDMTTIHRQPTGIPAGGQFAAATHTEPVVTVVPEAATVEDAYLGARSVDSALQLAAARRAVELDEHAFEELTREGDEDIVAAALADDEKVIRAVERVGDLDPEERGLFGKFLAEQLFEDAIDDEANKWLGRYRAERHLDREPEAQDLAYEASDPKHPSNRQDNAA